MTTQLLPDLLRLGYQGCLPEFVAAPRRLGAGAAVCGRVRVGSGAVLGPGAVIRGDSQEVCIGEDFFLGERSTVHGAFESVATRIGAGVTIGAQATLHGCQIGERCLIEDRCLVLEGARLGAGSVLEANSLVPAGAQLAGGTLYRGNPAQPVRALEAGELLLLRSRVRNAPVAEPEAADMPIDRHGRHALAGFLAPTARLEGRVQMAPSASIWLGARVDGGHHGIELGELSNLQDNCTAYAMASPLQIGAGVSVGHNVCLQDCRIGDRSLIGAASFVAAGTVVQSDVLLAPGSSTTPRQVLVGGWVWGGRPARALAPLSAEQRRWIAASAAAHRGYAVAFQQAAADLAELG